jgi:hypothetical protein
VTLLRFHRYERNGLLLRDQRREAGYPQQEEEESLWKIKTFLTGYAS